MTPVKHPISTLTRQSSPYSLLRRFQGKILNVPPHRGRTVKWYKVVTDAKNSKITVPCWSACQNKSIGDRNQSTLTHWYLAFGPINHTPQIVIFFRVFFKKNNKNRWNEKHIEVKKRRATPSYTAPKNPHTKPPEFNARVHKTIK